LFSLLHKFNQRRTSVFSAYFMTYRIVGEMPLS
jgi:hypothetical protein